MVAAGFPLEPVSARHARRRQGTANEGNDLSEGIVADEDPPSASRRRKAVDAQIPSGADESRPHSLSATSPMAASAAMPFAMPPRSTAQPGGRTTVRERRSRTMLAPVATLTRRLIGWPPVRAACGRRVEYPIRLSCGRSVGSKMPSVARAAATPAQIASNRQPTSRRRAGPRGRSIARARCRGRNLLSLLSHSAKSSRTCVMASPRPDEKYVHLRPHRGEAIRAHRRRSCELRRHWSAPPGAAGLRRWEAGQIPNPRRRRTRRHWRRRRACCSRSCRATRRSCCRPGRRTFDHVLRREAEEHGKPERRRHCRPPLQEGKPGVLASPVERTAVGRGVHDAERTEAR